jgi:hypothetical protein
MKRTALLRLGVAAGLLLGTAGTAWADDPPDMARAAKAQAEAAPFWLAMRFLALVELPTIETAHWRNVRAQYIRQELVNDQIVFCGEIDAALPATGERKGWTRFAYFPGDPPTLATETEGLGIHELGPRIVKKYCDAPDAKWLSADYTADFQQLPKNLAEARAALAGSK